MVTYAYSVHTTYVINALNIVTISTTRICVRLDMCGSRYVRIERIIKPTVITAIPMDLDML